MKSNQQKKVASILSYGHHNLRHTVYLVNKEKKNIIRCVHVFSALKLFTLKKKTYFIQTHAFRSPF